MYVAHYSMDPQQTIPYACNQSPIGGIGLIILT